jgi:hypothetical protein
MSLSIVMIVTMSVCAQPSFGIKTGLNLANASGDDADALDTKMRASFHVGGYLTFDVSEHFAIQPELLYNSVGSKFEESFSDPDFGNIDIDATFKLEYISVPVMFLYKVNDQFNIQAGPQAGFLVSAKAKAKGTAFGQSVSGSEDVKDEFKSVDFGVNFGVGVNFDRISASARYCLGLVNVIDEDEADYKNNAIQLSVGYKILPK